MLSLLLAFSTGLVQDKPKPDVDDLVLEIGKDGTCKSGDRVLVDAKEPDELRTLEDLFEERRMVAKYQETPGKAERVKYAVHLRLAPDAPLEQAQRIWMVAHHHGGVTRCVLTSGKSGDFATLKLPCDPPRKPAPGTAEPVRVILCAEKRPQEHVLDRATHSRSKKSPESILVEVAGEGVGELRADESKEEAARANGEVLAGAVRKAKELRTEGRDAKSFRPLLLDVDEEVPARYVIRLLAALEREACGVIQIDGSPRFSKYYGTYQKGQFQRDKK